MGGEIAYILIKYYFRKDNILNFENGYGMNSEEDMGHTTKTEMASVSCPTSINSHYSDPLHELRKRCSSRTAQPEH